MIDDHFSLLRKHGETEVRADADSNVLSPSRADRLFSRLACRPQMTNEPKTDQARHNLYEHVDGYDRVQASFSEEQRSGKVRKYVHRIGKTPWPALGACPADPAHTGLLAHRLSNILTTKKFICYYLNKYLAFL
jgi:hypothetical protein